MPLRDIAPVGLFEAGSLSEQNKANTKGGSETAQTEAYIARWTFCLVTVDILKTLLVIPPYRRASVAKMIAQFYKTAEIKCKEACTQHRRWKITCTHCA